MARKSKKAPEELREISDKVSKKSRAFWTDFKKFAVKGNIIDLAVAVVIGAAFNKIVSSLVSCIITPLTSMLLDTGSLADLKWVLREGVEENAEAGIEAVSEVAVTYGQFLQVTLDFLIIALSLYVVIKVFLKIKNAFHKKEREEAAERARIVEERKKAEAAAEAERQAKLRQEFIDDVAAQADLLAEIRDIMKQMAAADKKTEN